MSSYDEKSYDFLRQFRSFYSKLPASVKTFAPHYALWICNACKEMNFSYATENCISNGRYCIPDIDKKNLKTVIGREVVYEDLTQLCLFKLNEKKWWDYIEDFYTKCLKNKLYNSDLRSCSESVYLTNNYEKHKVEMCINDSYVDRSSTNQHNGENILLMQEQKYFMFEGIQLWPSLRINNETYRV